MKLVSLVLIALANWKSFASPEEDEAKALVKQLVSDSFRVREQAAKELVALGAGAFKALNEGCQSIDADVAERCRKLLPQAYDLHVQRSVAKYLADPKLPLSEDLPGVQRWRKVAGPSDESKRLFVEMLEKYHELLTRLAIHPNQHENEYPKLAQEMYNRLHVLQSNPQQQSQALSQVDLALFLFLTTDPHRKPDKKNVPPQLHPTCLILDRSNLKTYLEPITSREPFKRLFLEYLDRETNSVALLPGVHLAGSAKLKEALPLMLKVAKQKNLDGHLRAEALRVASQLGGSTILPEFVPFFEDTSLVAIIRPFNRKRLEIQFRDVALGLALHLTEQSQKDFGFVYALPRPTRFEDEGWAFHFALQDEAREPALKKWKAFAKKEKLLPETKK